MDERDRLGVLAGLAGVAAVGTVAAGGALRRMTRRTPPTHTDRFADHDFTSMYTDPSSTVVTDDGLALTVHTVDLWDSSTEPEPELTVLFVHGFSLRLASWHFQRYELARRWAGRRIRMVFFDHRGHGASERAPAQTCTIDQIADDTAAVVRAEIKTGPIVLVGHSMGGMALMGLARRHRELFGPGGRVAGVALVATASRGLTETGLGEGLRNPIVDAFRLSVRTAPRLVQAGRGLTRSTLEPVLVAGSFGRGFHSPAVGRAVEKMIQNTPIETLVNFLYALEYHDETTALPILAQVPTTVVCGGEDRLTPVANSVRMFAELGEDSRLVVAEGAGHMVTMEQPEKVTDAVAELVERARVAKPPPGRRWWLRRGAEAGAHPTGEPDTHPTTQDQR